MFKDELLTGWIRLDQIKPNKNKKCQTGVPKTQPFILFQSSTHFVLYTVSTFLSDTVQASIVSTMLQCSQRYLCECMALFGGAFARKQVQIRSKTCSHSTAELQHRDNHASPDNVTQKHFCPV